PNTYSPEMPDIFLEWNAEDPPTEVEFVRNTVLEDMQGNRNPFIDNPYLATIIWGGPDAENLWPNMGLEENVPAKTEVFPNPANSFLKIKSNKQIESVSLYTITGRLLFSEIKLKDDSVDVSKYPDGTYILIVNYSDNSRESRKVLVKR
ncbi:MAG: endonuclease, partial [Moheibacter sp.]